jgi:zinc transport system permease protein
VVAVSLKNALLTVPAAVAGHWTDRLSRMMGLAVLTGAVAIAAGLFLTFGLSSEFGVDLPTGPSIILLAAAVYAISAMARSFTGRFRGS